MDSAASADPRSLSTADLVAYIVSCHHEALRGSLPFLVPLTAKVARVHGDKDERLRELRDAFLELRAALEAHLESEEEALFREVVAEAPDAEVVRREIASMRAAHRQLEQVLGRIRACCDGFVPPEWACSSYRTLLAELQRLEDDVLRHVELENEVLLPRFA